MTTLRRRSEAFAASGTAVDFFMRCPEERFVHLDLYSTTVMVNRCVRSLVGSDTQLLAFEPELLNSLNGVARLNYVDVASRFWDPELLQDCWFELPIDVTSQFWRPHGQSTKCIKNNTGPNNKWTQPINRFNKTSVQMQMILTQDTIIQVPSGQQSWSSSVKWENHW